MSLVFWVIIGIIAVLFSASALMIVAAIGLASLFRCKSPVVENPFLNNPRSLTGLHGDFSESWNHGSISGPLRQHQARFRSTVFPSTNRA